MTAVPPHAAGEVYRPTSSVNEEQTSKGPNGCERCGTGSQDGVSPPAASQAAPGTCKESLPVHVAPEMNVR